MKESKDYTKNSDKFYADKRYQNRVQLDNVLVEMSLISELESVGVNADGLRGDLDRLLTVTNDITVRDFQEIEPINIMITTDESRKIPS